MLTGWIDAAGAGATAAAVVSTECGTRAARALRRRHVHRLPRPPTDDGAPRRPQHRPRLGDDRTACRALGRRSRHPAAHRARSPTWRGTGSPPPSATSPCELGVTQMVALRRLSLRHPAHPPAAPVVHVAVDRRARQRHVRPQLGRRPRRHGRRARTRAARAEDPGARHLGAGTALRGGDGVPGGVGRVARRAQRGHRHHGRGDRPARATSPSSASGSTSRSATTPTTSRCCASSRRSTTPPTANGEASRAGRRARPRDAVRRRTRRRDPALPQRTGLTRAHRPARPTSITGAHYGRRP